MKGIEKRQCLSLDLIFSSCSLFQLAVCFDRFQSFLRDPLRRFRTFITLVISLVLGTFLRSRKISEPTHTATLIPFHRSQFATSADEKPVTQPFEYSPSPAVVLESIMPGYISGFIYSALVDSFCSEQHARMAAMKSANDSAEELINGLRTQYNRLRQAAITQEITEIAAGARARAQQEE